MNVADINLTDEDFKLLVEGLEAIPQINSAKELMSAIVQIALAPTPEMAKRAAAQVRADMHKKNPADEVKAEDVKILQGKLILLKRFLQEKATQSEIDSALNKE